MLVRTAAVILAWSGALVAQEPAKWAAPLEFHTFSIVAVDPVTRETGVAETTRNPCVGNAVPGFVDARTIERLWQRLREAGRADDIRKRLIELQRVR